MMKTFSHHAQAPCTQWAMSKPEKAQEQELIIRAVQECDGGLAAVGPLP